jgi:hypothetical protein
LNLLKQPLYVFFDRLARGNTISNGFFLFFIILFLSKKLVNQLLRPHDAGGQFGFPHPV